MKAVEQDGACPIPDAFRRNVLLHIPRSPLHQKPHGLAMTPLDGKSKAVASVYRAGVQEQGHDVQSPFACGEHKSVRTTRWTPAALESDLLHQLANDGEVATVRRDLQRKHMSGLTLELRGEQRIRFETEKNFHRQQLSEPSGRIKWRLPTLSIAGVNCRSGTKDQ